MLNLLVNLLLLIVICAHIIICPYTKVEESFNIQAIHDLIYHQANVSKYDHHEYPGVVPRSFIGPLAVGVFAWPVARVIDIFGISKFSSQVVSRFILGLFTYLSLLKYHSVIKKQLGCKVAILSVVFIATQFHIVFYASRTLPNIFALVLVLRAFASWLQKENASFLWYSASAIIIFRFELAILLGLLLLCKLLSRELSFKSFIVNCFIAGPTFLTMTVLIDSYFWGRWLWPEGEVLYFNTILNKSSQWGTLPFWWYFNRAIPKSLLLVLIFVPFSFLSKETKKFNLLHLCCLGYVFVYSILPHKELRFIIYVLPVLNTSASVGFFKLLEMLRNRKYFTYCLKVILVGIILFNTVASSFMLYISHHNYAGGVAFKKLHENNNKIHEKVNIHICNEAAQTGVTRFGEISHHWRYWKNESFVFDPLSDLDVPYDYMISNAPCQVSKHFHVANVINGFENIVFSKSSSFIEIKLNPKLCIIEAKSKINEHR